MIVRRMLWGMFLVALASSAASAAGEPFVVEGLVDPAALAAKTAGKSAADAEAYILSQATLNAALHLGAYTHGVQFAQQQGADGRYGFVVMGVDFQPVGGLSPETKKLRVLKSGLELVEVSYGAEVVPLLNLPKDYFSLPIYRVKGEFWNGEMAMSKMAEHGKAASEAYHAALVEHLAKQYPGKEIVYVKGRIYPVRVIEAELLPAASGAAAPSSATSAMSASAATSAARAAAVTPASSAAAAGPTGFDSRQFIYRVEMDVRVSIRPEDVKFSEEKPATSAAAAVSAVSAAPAGSASSAAAAR